MSATTSVCRALAPIAIAGTRMFLRLTPPNPQRGHVRQMASAPSTVEFCFRLRAAFALHGYVHNCLSSDSGINIGNTAPYAGQMCDVPTAFLVDWELRCQEAGAFALVGPVVARG